MPNYRDPFGDDLFGPYLDLTVRWNGRDRPLLALVDTGADYVQIPHTAAEELELQQIDTIDSQSAHGDWRESPLFVGDISFLGMTFEAVEMISDEYPIALIGRNVLAELVATLNGPARSFDLVRPSASV